jgi:hypothetical protein
MATILKFIQPTTRKTTAEKTGRTAEIVIFPGVRYERWGTAVTPAKPKRKRRTRAKREGMTVAV